MRKRFAVLQRIYTAYQNEKTRQKKTSQQQHNQQQKQGLPQSASTTSVAAPTTGTPLVVRLGILTIFPVLEALRSVKDIDYAKLCHQIMNTLLEMLMSLPPLSLQQEPVECLDAYQKFIYQMIAEKNFQIQTQEDRRVFSFSFSQKLCFLKQ